MNIVLFEDEMVDRLSPITLARPAWSITCGSLRLCDLVAHLDGTRHGVVRDFLSAFVGDYFPVRDLDASQPTLWLNARLAPDAALLGSLKKLMGNASAFIAMSGESISAAMTEAGAVRAESLTVSDIPVALSELNLPHSDLELSLFDYPHNVIADHKRLAASNIEFLATNGDYQQLQDGVFVAGGRELPANVVLDTTSGPIVIDVDVELGPFSVIKGPVSIGRGAKISPHALLKGPITVGHTTKIGGEVGSSVIEPYSNKVHYGYLGASWLGSWVNLGAGTCNSNLKNTYGTIRVSYESGKVDTGLQFLGCVIGDYTKTAINTSIYTGKIVGVCSNVYGTVTTNVPSFSNYARSFGETTEQPADVMKVTQKRCFSRRGLEQEQRHLDLIDTMYRIEAPKRKLANHPLSL